MPEDSGILLQRANLQPGAVEITVVLQTNDKARFLQFNVLQSYIIRQTLKLSSQKSYF